MQRKLLAALIVCGVLASVAEAQRGALRPEGVPAGPDHPRSSIQRWADQLANDLDYLEEDLHYGRGNVSRALIREAEATSEAVAHFREVLRRSTDDAHLRRDFREMDRQVHQLVDRLNQTGDSWLNRHAARIRYADEQLHYLLQSDAVGDGADGFREVLARHAHVLEAEARQLEQLVEQLGPRGVRGDALLRAVREFTDEAIHFHQVVERGADRRHLRDDFGGADDAWRRVVSEINVSPYGLYLRRVALRLDRVHNQIRDLLGRTRTVPDRPAPPAADRPRFEFQIPGIGRFELR